ncbi:MAG: VOC family protein [Minwuia sp.]|uniref:VOC family protein n=1 Tax=Minwuia sp. TaxID=2493630 RepID=UPI003A88F1E6
MSGQGKFVWNELATSDLEGALSFYRDVVGWEVEAVDMAEGGTYHILRSGDEMRGGVMSTAEISGDPPQPHWMSYIGVDDVDDTCAKAKAAGGQILNGPFDVPDVGRMAVIMDPQGAVVSVMKMLPEE